LEEKDLKFKEHPPMRIVIPLAPDGSKRIEAKHARYHQHGNDAD
jgi:hypothetical protein